MRIIQIRYGGTVGYKPAAGGVNRIFYKFFMFTIKFLSGFYCILFTTTICLTTWFLHCKNYNGNHNITTTDYDFKIYNDAECRLELVETIPIGLNYSEDSPKFQATYAAWRYILNNTESDLNIASFYWTMLQADVIKHPSALLGEEIFQDIKAIGEEHRVNIRIVEDASQSKLDTGILKQSGAADVRYIDFKHLLGGVLHTKLWIADNKHFYLGSANMDWRSLTQVKELGVLGINCSILASDFNKIFEEYWYLSRANATLPKVWSSSFSTIYNFSNPFRVTENHLNAFVSSSPPQLSACGREDDIYVILRTIMEAKLYINIAVMDYFPLIMYSKNKSYWPLIDNALRKAAIDNKVCVKILISWWPHSRSSEAKFLESLAALSGVMQGVSIQIKKFIVPSNNDQNRIPFSRVNHNKYMVTDTTAYIGTSNWSGDYFTTTAGIGLHLQDSISNVTTIRDKLLSIFNRDWNSPYAENLTTI